MLISMENVAHFGFQAKQKSFILYTSCYFLNIPQSLMILCVYDVKLNICELL